MWREVRGGVPRPSFSCPVDLVAARRPWFPGQFQSKERVMRRFLPFVTLVFALTLALPGSAAAQAEPWAIDGAHSAAQFSVRHFGVSTVRGGFTKITGTIAIDDKDLTQSTVDVTIDATTVNTQNEGRDRHLKSADFFDIEKFPTMTFKSKKVEKAGAGRLKVTGDFTLHGVTKEIVLDVEGPTPPLTMPQNRGWKRGATATTKVNRRDFGLVWGTVVEGVAAVSDEVNITIDLELNKRPPAPPAN
jgi:polyisoprenoid-binding protein YceI